MGELAPRRRDHDCICHTGSDQGVTVTDLAESETAILALRQQVADLTTLVQAQQARVDEVTGLSERVDEMGEVIEDLRVAAAGVVAACDRIHRD